MDTNRLRKLVKNVTTLSKKLQDDGPLNDDELHAWVKANIGVDIPRVAVCSDHVPPFKFLADLYFERVGSAFGMASRGGAKTFIVAILHYLNSKYKSGCESVTFGATAGQANRCYGNIENWCYERDPITGRKTDKLKDDLEKPPMRSETVWKTGAKIEVIIGTEAGVNSPHPQKAHADEVELMRQGAWDESRNMTVSKQATGPLPPFMEKFGGVIPPQDIATSTRKSKHGRVQEIINEVQADIDQGNMPLFEFFIWCIWECASEVPMCRQAAKAEREKRLKELSRDPKELCDCNKVVKGRMADGSPRTLEKVCEGKMFRSRGWKPLHDIKNTFKQNSPGVWVLQQECRESLSEYNYIPDWSEEYYGIKNYTPDPHYGPIYMGIDWGGTNPHCVLWFQYLRYEIEAFDFNESPIYLASDTYVFFDEIYVAEIDTAKLATLVIQREREYKQLYAEQGKHWYVKGRFADPAGASDKIHFATRGMPCSWPVKTRDFEKTVNVVQNIFADDRVVVDIDKCPMFCEEAAIWQKDEKTGEQVDNFNHAMSAMRYGLSNSEIILSAEKGRKRGGFAHNKQENNKTIRKMSENFNGVKKIGPVAIMKKNYDVP